jgi:dienelactone hydrolase
MRCLFLFPLALSFGAAACNAQPTSNTASANTAKPAEAAAIAEPLLLKASDGVIVHGLYYEAANPKALILLFHQAGSSKEEYATIAPRLLKAGFSALAIDQRAGDGMFGTNETAKAFDREVRYREARPDLQAALDWAQQQKLPIILWGSSYSSALIFPLAADDPQGIVALLAFSPGEYFDGDPPVRAAAAKLNIPVLIASTGEREETGYADPIMAAVRKTANNVRLIPEHAVHGSSMLIAKRNPDGAEANWRAVMAFLNDAIGSR